MTSPWPPAEMQAHLKTKNEIQSPTEITAAKMRLSLAAGAKSKEEKGNNEARKRARGRDDRKQRACE